MSQLYCPGNREGHVYETSGDRMSCVHCPRITRYDPVSKTWKAVQK